MKKKRKRKIPIYPFALAIDRMWMDVPDEHLKHCAMQPFLNVISRKNGQEVALVGRMASSKLDDFFIAVHLDRNLALQDAKNVKKQRNSMPEGNWDKYDCFRPDSVIVPICYCFRNDPFLEFTNGLSICPMRFVLEFTNEIINAMVLQAAQRGKQTANGTPIQAIGVHGDMRWLKPENRAPLAERSGYIEMSEVHYNPDAKPLTFQGIQKNS